MEVGDDVRELGPRAALERLLERLDVDAVGLQRDGQELGPQSAQRQQCAVIAGRLDHHQVAGLHERPNRNASACIEPLVAITCSGGTPWRSAIHSTSGL